MQTLDFTRSLAEIVTELRIKELFTLMQGWLLDPLRPLNPNLQAHQQVQQQHPIPEDQKKQFASLLFNSHAGYDRLSRLESPSKILKGMDSSELYEPGRLARIMNLVSGVGFLEQLRGSGDVELFDFFETLKAFLRVESTCRTRSSERSTRTMRFWNSSLRTMTRAAWHRRESRPRSRLWRNCR